MPLRGSGSAGLWRYKWGPGWKLKRLPLSPADCTWLEEKCKRLGVAENRFLMVVVRCARRSRTSDAEWLELARFVGLDDGQ